LLTTPWYAAAWVGYADSKLPLILVTIIDEGFKVCAADTEFCHGLPSFWQYVVLIFLFLLLLFFVVQFFFLTIQQ
jgi:hypothetical protein